MAELLARSKPQLFRVSYKTSVSPELRQWLWFRCNWIDVVAQVMCVAGLAGGVILPWLLHPGHSTFWDITVQFGLAILFPCGWCWVITLSQGKHTLDEFLIFYSLKYGIHWRGLFVFFYLPIMLAGGCAAAIIYL